MKTQIHKQLISGFLLVLFVAFYFNIAFFQHKHIIDEIKIVHSHFHKECHHNTDSGGHTPCELFLISKNSTFETLETILSTDISNPIVICDVLEIFILENSEVGFSDYCFLRGPPTLALLTC
jgi:hypothetical protein